MSRTEMKHGKKVEEAIRALSCGKGQAGSNAFVTAGQVAISAECSKPSAMKYLRILQQHEIVSAIQLVNKQWLWIWGSW